MKKILWLIFILSFFFASHTFAATTFTASSTGTTITAKMTGLTGNTDTFRLGISTEAFTNTAADAYTKNDAQGYNTVDTDKKAAIDGTITWNIANYSNLTSGTTYYVRVIEVTGTTKKYASNTTKLIIGGASAAPGATKLNLIASANGTTISATLTGITKPGQYKLVTQTTPFNTNTYTGAIPADNAYLVDPTIKRADLATGAKSTSVTWSLAGNQASTTYYVRAVDVSYNPAAGSTAQPTLTYINNPIAVITQAATVPFLPLTTKKDGDNVIVEGQINRATIPDFTPANYTALLSYSQTPPAAGAKVLTNAKGPLKSLSTEDINGKEGINADGSYYWYLTSLSPSTTYYIQQTIMVDNKNPVNGTIDNFNSSSGNIVNSGASQVDYNEQHGYTLLSKGLPNFTFLPDPDLCAQQRAAGLTPQFCDMNDVINYAIKLLIGLAAVSLVFRIMYEGYVILTSDTPFKVSSAKRDLYTAAGGLLLALTSFIILNTINPKLVNGTVSLNQLAIGVDDDYDTLQSVKTSAPTGSIPKGTAGKCTAGIASVNTSGGTFWACKSISDNLAKLMTAAHAAGLNLSGGGFRTASEQIQLRKEHCGTTYVYTAGARCNPPTALPGKSNHESGLAFDFTCDKTLIQSTDNKCFIWLKNNAATYGLYNFPKEQWHWSVDGR